MSAASDSVADKILSIIPEPSDREHFEPIIRNVVAQLEAHGDHEGWAAIQRDVHKLVADIESGAVDEARELLNAYADHPYFGLAIGLAHQLMADAPKPSAPVPLD